VLFFAAHQLQHVALILHFKHVVHAVFGARKVSQSHISFRLNKESKRTKKKTFQENILENIKHKKQHFEKQQTTNEKQTFSKNKLENKQNNTKRNEKSTFSKKKQIGKQHKTKRKINFFQKNSKTKRKPVCRRAERTGRNASSAIDLPCPIRALHITQKREEKKKPFFSDTKTQNNSFPFSAFSNQKRIGQNQDMVAKSNDLHSSSNSH
jgi:hypothetical protein